MPDYATGTVRSADGTTIGYRRYGDSGPGLVLVHGGMKAAQHLSVLAADLAADFTVVVPDRRGRGRSGPHGPDYGIRREVQDLAALIAATGARYLFGHSSGALAGLRTALETPALQRIALYEPPLPVRGSVPTGWLPRFDREIAAGRRAAAAVTALRGTGLEPAFDRIPRWLLTGFGAVGLRLERPGPDAVAIAELVPTMHFDIQLVRELADTAAECAGLRIPVLLLSGTRSPAFLETATRELAAVLPRAHRHTLTGLGHTAPEDDGAPHRIATQLRDFLTTPADDWP